MDQAQNTTAAEIHDIKTRMTAVEAAIVKINAALDSLGKTQNWLLAINIAAISLFGAACVAFVVLVAEKLP